jgi:DnaJ homolog subfamily A member 5
MVLSMCIVGLAGVTLGYCLPFNLVEIYVTTVARASKPLLHRKKSNGTKRFVTHNHISTNQNLPGDTMNEDGTAKLRCHYEVLGVERDADISTIKKAHRKLALKWHPDKNIGDDSAQHLFLEVQQAYECLNDPAERKWYDDHRDAILKGWTATGNSSTKDQMDILFNVMPYMFAGCFRGYNDDATGFFAIYRNVFEQVYQGERDGCESSKTDVDYLDVSFGASNSPWDSVVAFYQAWESFSSILNYAWADQWNVQEAEQRRVRRAMDEDNKRARRKARYTRNEEIAALVHFVKRRDPRVIHHKERQEMEKLLKEKELKEAAAARKEEKAKAMEEWREQAEREFVAAEEEDRLQGRIRLADLEDDYDYGGGKKKGKGRKKKGRATYEEHVDYQEGLVEEDAGAVDSNPCYDNVPGQSERLSGNEPNAVDKQISDNGASEDSRPQPAGNDWSCDCCHEVFQTKVDMLNHLKSKSHKDAAMARKLEKKQDEDNDKKRDKKKKSKKQLELADSEVAESDERTDGKRHMDVAQYNEASGEAQIDIAPNELPCASADLGVVSDENEQDDEVEPDFWRCQCCQKNFQSEGQMESHMKSKKHKQVFRAYEKVLGKKLLNEVIEELHTNENDQ